MRYIYILLILVLLACKKDPVLFEDVYAVDPNFSPTTTDLYLLEDEISAFCYYENNYVRAIVDSISDMQSSWYLIDEDGKKLFLSHNARQLLTKSATYRFVRKGLYENNELDTVIDFKLEYCPAFIDFPEVFTPNSDGQYDFWGPIGEGVKTIEFSVQNNSGLELFQGSSMEEKWNGKYNGVLSSPGTYEFSAKGSLKSGYIFEFTGTFELIH